MLSIQNQGPGLRTTPTSSPSSRAERSLRSLLERQHRATQQQQELLQQQNSASPVATRTSSPSPQRPDSLVDLECNLVALVERSIALQTATQGNGRSSPLPVINKRASRPKFSTSPQANSNFSATGLNSDVSSLESSVGRDLLGAAIIKSSSSQSQPLAAQLNNKTQAATSGASPPITCGCSTPPERVRGTRRATVTEWIPCSCLPSPNAVSALPRRPSLPDAQSAYRTQVIIGSSLYQRQHRNDQPPSQQLPRPFRPGSPLPLPSPRPVSPPPRPPSAPIRRQDTASCPPSSYAVPDKTRGKAAAPNNSSSRRSSHSGQGPKSTSASTTPRRRPPPSASAYFTPAQLFPSGRPTSSGQVPITGEEDLNIGSAQKLPPSPPLTPPLPYMKRTKSAAGTTRSVVTGPAGSRIGSRQTSPRVPHSSRLGSPASRNSAHPSPAFSRAHPAFAEPTGPGRIPNLPQISPAAGGVNVGLPHPSGPAPPTSERSRVPSGPLLAPAAVSLPVDATFDIEAAARHLRSWNGRISFDDVALHPPPSADSDDDQEGKDNRKRPKLGSRRWTLW